MSNSKLMKKNKPSTIYERQMAGRLSGSSSDVYGRRKNNKSSESPRPCPPNAKKEAVIKAGFQNSKIHKTSSSPMRRVGSKIEKSKNEFEQVLNVKNVNKPRSATHCQDLVKQSNNQKSCPSDITKPKIQPHNSTRSFDSKSSIKQKRANSPRSSPIHQHPIENSNPSMVQINETKINESNKMVFEKEIEYATHKPAIKKKPSSPRSSLIRQHPFENSNPSMVQNNETKINESDKMVIEKETEYATPKPAIKKKPLSPRISPNEHPNQVKNETRREDVELPAVNDTISENNSKNSNENMIQIVDDRIEEINKLVLEMDDGFDQISSILQSNVFKKFEIPPNLLKTNDPANS